MVQHVADRVASFPRSPYSPPSPPLKFLHTPPPSFAPLRARELRDNHHHDTNATFKTFVDIGVFNNFFIRENNIFLFFI